LARNACVSEKFGSMAQRAGNRELQTLLTATVRDVGRRTPVFVDGSTSVREAARVMKDKKVKSVLVRHDGKLGIFTTTDFRDIVLESPRQYATATCAASTARSMWVTSCSTPADHDPAQYPPPGGHRQWRSHRHLVAGGHPVLLLQPLAPDCAAAGARDTLDELAKSPGKSPVWCKSCSATA
jgi:hypothetical protein